jgi:syntaxin 18
LHKELKDVRQAYLSTAQPRRGRHGQDQAQALTNQEREEVDANAKQMVRELNASIRGLDDAEQLRRETESAVIRKKYTGGLASLGSWASGGMASNKSADHAEAEAKAQQTTIHRDGVLWFLRQRLELCCRTQQDMMETRLKRELEKSRGLLAPAASDFAVFPPTAAMKSQAGTGDDNAWGQQNDVADQGLTEEQVQMFEKDNQDMMKHYETTLDKVRYTQLSMA